MSSSTTFIDKYLKSPLKGVHAHKGVRYIRPYDKFGDTMCCGLCDNQKLFRFPYNGINEKHVAILEDHVRSVTHESRYSQLVAAQKAFVKDMKQKRLDRSEFLRDLIKTLPLDQWRWHMYGLVMQYIDTPLHKANDYCYCEDPRVEENDRDNPGQQNLEIALTQLAKYVQMERLSLLEFAIMKSKPCNSIECLIIVAGKKRDAERNEVKSSTETRIVKSGAAVIIPLVVQFLGEPSLEAV